MAGGGAGINQPHFQIKIQKGTVNMNITYYYSDGTNRVYHSANEQAACISAYNYMALHADIQQATIWYANTCEVYRVYSR